VNLPNNVTDITTAATIIQIAVPELKLVMDPLLYLRALPKPQGVPKIIHMTMASKHRLAPHQILSIISWGWYVRVTVAAAPSYSISDVASAFVLHQGSA
jgi:hypothetical protein